MHILVCIVLLHLFSFFICIYDNKSTSEVFVRAQSNYILVGFISTKREPPVFKDARLVMVVLLLHIVILLLCGDS